MSIADVNAVTNCIVKIKSTLANGEFSTEQLQGFEKSIRELHLDVDAQLDELEANDGETDSENATEG